MSSRKNKPPLGLEMDFDEALRRFARVDPEEMKDAIPIKKGGKKPPPKIKPLT